LRWGTSSSAHRHFADAPLQSQPPPTCLSSVRQSSTLDVLRRFATFVITPRGRCIWRMSQSGMRPDFFNHSQTNNECVHRQALRYIIRNTTLPQRVRAQAQLQLSQMHCYTRFTQVKNRCIMGGKGRGVLSDFRLGRVRKSDAREKTDMLILL
jgi:ribosomal protein S14